MASSQAHFFHVILLFLMISFIQPSLHQPLCHEVEHLALTQFSKSFVIDRHASAYPKVDLWESQGVDCCLWEGVWCDQRSGYVIGLDLSNSFLFGSIDSSSSLFHLVYLRHLNLAFNDFNYSEIPPALGNLSSLTYLNLSDSFFAGQIPFEISKLTRLAKLDLSNNSVKGSTAPFLSNLTQLDYVDLGYNQFTFTEIPSLARSTHLKVLDLSYNKISGPFPSWLVNLTQLTELMLKGNLLNGSFPHSISKLKNLETLSVSENNFSGIVDFGTFSGLRNLKVLSLSENNFTLLTKNITYSSLPKFYYLSLRSCNLREFPDFLRDQDQLGGLDLSFNDIHGQVPKWLLETSANLFFLNLSHNSLTSFQDPNNVVPSGLYFLGLSFNFLTGPLPIPPHSIIIYEVARNKFSGEIPPEFCNTTSLVVLEMSQNNLSGTIPHCLSNQSKSLSILNLEENNFHGLIPETWVAGSKLRVMKLGHNNLEGRLPRWLANCTTLEYLDLSNNGIRDTFPSWLGVLPQLKILILRFNGFFGAINVRESGFMFPKLRIIDLSNNKFAGPLPIEYFRRWNAMGNLDRRNATYLYADYTFAVNTLSGTFVFPYSVTIINKGLEMDYAKILDVFIAVDLSGNKFEGEIPEAVGDLSGLQLLNLSNNILVGPIPSALGYLSNIEALDLSHNKLDGRLPTQLTQLNFLAVFNVSRNVLTGPIPQGKQFATFDNSSFDGNIGLCGLPLSKKCDSSQPEALPTSSTSEDNEVSSFLAGFGWKAVLLGFGCGFVGGVVIGPNLFAMKQEWFMKNFRVR